MNTNLAWQEEPQEEVIGGKVVMMSSPALHHILIAGNIYTIFNNYLRGKPCTPLPDGATLYLAEGETYKPDMMVVCDPEKLRSKGVYGAPELVVEVLSPSTARNDRGYKKKMYERSGVGEYWLVDPGNRSVEQYVLEEGELVLRDVFTLFREKDLRDMEEREKAAWVNWFRCTLFEDLVIRLEDVFDRVP